MADIVERLRKPHAHSFGVQSSELEQDAAKEIERQRDNFAKALTAMGECLDCLEQNDDPDTVAIKILRDAMYVIGLSKPCSFILND